VAPVDEREAILQIIREIQDMPPERRRRRERIISEFSRLNWRAASTEKSHTITQLEADGLIKIEIPPPQINPMGPSLNVSEVHHSDLRSLLHATIATTLPE